MFSPPAVVIAAAGAGESMRAAERNAPDRIQRLAETSPEFRAALAGYRFVAPHIEYHERMTINLGGRTIELIYLKGVHSEADTAVWLPNDRGGRRRRASSRQAADRAAGDRAGAELRGRRASRGLCKNDIRVSAVLSL